MAGKHTMLFKLVTESALDGGDWGPSGTVGERIGGWSESYYSNVDTIFRTAFETLCSRRAAMLPKQARIVGQRYQLVLPTTGRSSVFGRVFQGNAAMACDVPQMSLLINAINDGTGKTARRRLAGIPDAVIVKGEYDPTVSSPFHTALGSFINELTASGWYFPSREPDGDTRTIAGAIAPDIIFVDAPVTWAVGDLIRVKMAMDNDGNRVGGRYRIRSITGFTEIRLWNFNLDLPTGGQVFKESFVMRRMDSIAVARVSQRKVGRPFGQYVGRRSRQKKR